MDYIQQKRNEIAKAEKTLMPLPRLELLEKMKNEAKAYMETIDSRHKSEIKKAQDAAEKLKPKINKISDEERKKTPELVALGNRKLDSKNVTVMSYLTKTVLSKITVEADTHEDFMKIIEELANHEDENMRYVLIDGFPELYNAGLGREKDQSLRYEMKEHYKAAIQSLKTPEELEYEEALKEVGNVVNSGRGGRLAEQRTLTDYIRELDGKITWLQGELSLDKRRPTNNAWAKIY